MSTTELQVLNSALASFSSLAETLHTAGEVLSASALSLPDATGANATIRETNYRHF